MKIYKYKIGNLLGDYTISIPLVAMHGVYLDLNGEAFMYATIDESAALHDVTIHVCWTGLELPEAYKNWKHIATLSVGTYMCHYFIDK